MTDLVAGAALVAAVRMGDPLAEPLMDEVRAGLHRLQQIAG